MLFEGIKKHKNGISIDFFAVPASSLQMITYDVWRKKILVKVNEAPVKGAANTAIEQFFSSVFNCPCRIIKGKKSKNKIILLENIELDNVFQILEQIFQENKI